MRKRERENPCGVCGHYHKYEEGEVCGVCGHRMPTVTDKSASSSAHASAFPSEILPDFLYLGSYDNASRAELLRTQRISHILNTVPACQNLYKNSFTYHCLHDDTKLHFDDAIQFLEQCEKDRARVLVHCMSGKNRSPAIVIAFLMKSKGWKLVQSYQWVKERRPSVEITQAIYHQLQEYEQQVFGSMQNTGVSLPSFPPSNPLSFSFGFPKPNDPTVGVPSFNNISTTTIFSRPSFDVPHQFSFGAGQTAKSTSDESTFGTNTNTCNGNDIPMDGS
ncbi:Protein-tyrosine-phosphatase IBR5 [Abeliophyllum distichum]|uniref:Protein-tyrosine-phosphatase IBR5 n=1 Tax=Abeliophyllum distichum TaxID=126358 RepID=A0ABD1NS98_9LAMI